MKSAVFFLVLIGISAVYADTFTFGINIVPDSPLAGWYKYTDQQALVGLGIWKDWWNSLPVSSRTTKWGQVIEVDLHVESYADYTGTNASLTGLFNTYKNMAQNESINYLFGTIGFAGIKLRQYLYSLGVPVMVFPSDSSDLFYDIPGSFGAPTANVLTMTSWLPYLRTSKAKTVVVVYVNDGVFESEMCQGIVAQAPYNGLRVVAEYGNMPFDWESGGEIDGNATRKAIWSSTIDKIIALNPDALAICDYGAGIEYTLNYIKTKGWTPGSIIVSPLYRTLEDPSVLDYVVSPQAYSPQATYPPQTDFTNSAGYNKLVLEKYGMEATSIMAQATLSGMLYTNALVNAESNSSTDLISAMQVQQIQTFMGTTAVDGRRRQTILSLLAQFMNSTRQTRIVGPAQAAADQFIYPMPKWNDRKYSPHWGSKVEITSVVLIGIGCLVSIALLVYVVVMRTHKIIYASSPIFCCCILVGSIILYTSLVVWMPNLVSTTTCNLRAWLLPLGFTTIFGALLAKTHRVHVLLTLNSTKIIKVKDIHVAFIMFIFISAQIAISVLMVSISEIKAVVHVQDPYRPSLNYKECTFPAVTKAFMWVDVVGVIGLFCWGSYLVYHIRKIPYAIYDESKSIGFSIYNCLFFSIIVLVVHLTIGNKNRDLTYMIMAASCFLSGIITICCIFIPKIYAVRMYISKTTSNSNSTSTSSHTKNSQLNSDEENGNRKDLHLDEMKDEIDIRNVELKNLTEKYEAAKRKAAKSNNK